MKTTKIMAPAFFSLLLISCNDNSTETKTNTDSISQPGPNNTPVYNPPATKGDTASYEKMVNKISDSIP